VQDIVIIGAGPAGLAAAIAAKEHGLRAVVLEKGALVNSLLHYPSEMVYFTTPELMEIGGMPFVSPHDKPNRLESLRYYRRVTDAFGLDIVLQERVTGIRRAGDGLFRVTSHSPTATEPVLRQARAVIIATGAYDISNPLDVPGEELPHVSHYYREPHSHFRRKVVIVGGKNSAAEAALDIYRAGGQPTLVHRGEALGESIKYWVKPDIENRIKEGSVKAHFSTRVVEITPTEVVVNGPAGQSRLEASFVYLLTGYRSDTSLLRAAGVDVEPVEGAPFHNPETYETNVEGLYVIGACVAGKQSGRIFIENGRFHGQVAVAHLAGRLGVDR